MDRELLKDLRLEGSQIVLTRWTTDNIEKVVELGNNPKIPANLLIENLNLTKESALKNVQDWSEPDKLGKVFGICVTGCFYSQIMGTSGEDPKKTLCHWNHNQRSPAEKHLIEFGYWLGEPFWGRGLATEAVKLMTEYLFSSKYSNLLNDGIAIERIEACIMAHNVASGKVLEKNGFTLEGIQKKRYFKNGTFVDGLLYAKFRS